MELSSAAVVAAHLTCSLLLVVGELECFLLDVSFQICCFEGSQTSAITPTVVTVVGSLGKKVKEECSSVAFAVSSLWLSRTFWCHIITLMAGQVQHK